MANIFQSKEVLKKARKPNGEVVIVPVYGMYVSGEYKPPYYNNNNGVFISSINTNKATVADFTTEYIDMHPDFACGLASIDAGVDFNIQTYETVTAPNQKDFACGLCAISVDIQFSIQEYGRDYYDLPQSFACGLASLNVDLNLQISGGHDIANMTPESLLLLTNIRTTAATISNS